MKRIFSGIMLIVLILTGSSSARVWYVKPDSTGAAINIQAGIDSCAAGDTVVALPGVYRGDGNWDIDFKGKPIVVMSGSSFDAAVMDSTMIDCQNAHRAFCFHSNEDSSSVLKGFVIQWGNVEMPSKGGGIYCMSSSPTIANNRIRFCYAFGGGSGISCVDSSPKIVGNRVHRCTSPYSGAGMLCEGGSPYIVDNRIYDNDCTMRYNSGAGLSCSGCTSLRVIGNKIYGNSGGSNYTRITAGGYSDLDRGTLRMSSLMAPGGVSIGASDGIIDGNTITHNGGELEIWGGQHIGHHK